MSEERRAPVQDRSGIVKSIPWEMHLRAYAAYCKKWSPQPALVDLEGHNCRGGFSTGELDDFIPGWRDELPELETAIKKVATLTAQLAASREREGKLRAALEDARQNFAVIWEYPIPEQDNMSAANMRQIGKRGNDLAARVLAETGGG